MDKKEIFNRLENNTSSDMTEVWIRYNKGEPITDNELQTMIADTKACITFLDVSGFSSQNVVIRNHFQTQLHALTNIEFHRNFGK